MEMENADVKPQYHCDLSYFRENMSVQHAVRDGLVVDWDIWQELWDHSMSSYVKVDCRETPVLMAEKAYNSSAARQKCVSIFTFLQKCLTLLLQNVRVDV